MIESYALLRIRHKNVSDAIYINYDDFSGIAKSLSKFVALESRNHSRWFRCDSPFTPHPRCLRNSVNIILAKPFFRLISRPNQCYVWQMLIRRWSDHMHHCMSWPRKRTGYRCKLHVGINDCWMSKSSEHHYLATQLRHSLATNEPCPVLSI